VKIEIRKQALAARDAMPLDERKAKSREIEERLFSLDEFISARIVMFFASFQSEVDTIPMIRRALTTGKRVVLPKVVGWDLALFEIKDLEQDISPGTWGIPEPRESHAVGLDEIDLILVPGGAFDEHGNRLGYGAGFYDKLLATFKKMTVAPAFEAQIVSRIPMDPHDIPVKKIVTEKRVIETNLNNQAPSSG
jgi:5-formyltetrahydrofolate cyclo-ligase